MPDKGVLLHAVRPLNVTKRGFLASGTAALAGILVSGCARIPQSSSSLHPDLPTRSVVTGVPLIEQSAFHCGPAALAMVHQWAGLDVTESKVARLAFTPTARGTYQADMLGASRRLGQLAVRIHGLNALFGEIAAGHPVIVFQNLGLSVFPVWHYAVVVAYDRDQDVIILHSGERRRMVMEMSVFQNSWERAENWAVVVLPPERLPAQARELDILRAAAALERVKNPKAAEEAYRAGIARWPAHWIWHFGLGNALYAQGRLVAAREAFTEAVALDPTRPEAQNNLAEVKAELAKS